MTADPITLTPAEYDRLLAARAAAWRAAADEAEEHKHFAKGIECCAELERVIRAHVEKALEMAAKIAKPHSDRTAAKIRAILADDVMREMGGRGNG